MQIETNIDTQLPTISPAIPFAIHHARLVLSRFTVRPDGRIPFHYLFGIPCVSPLCTEHPRGTPWHVDSVTQRYVHPHSWKCGTKCLRINDAVGRKPHPHELHATHTLKSADWWLPRSCQKYGSFSTPRQRQHVLLEIHVPIAHPIVEILRHMDWHQKNVCRCTAHGWLAACTRWPGLTHPALLRQKTIGPSKPPSLEPMWVEALEGHCHWLRHWRPRTRPTFPSRPATTRQRLCVLPRDPSTVSPNV